MTDDLKKLKADMNAKRAAHRAADAALTGAA
jgi:hypothetical protein